MMASNKTATLTLRLDPTLKDALRNAAEQEHRSLANMNPIACALTWGALNIIGAGNVRQAEIKKAKDSVFKTVEEELEHYGVETDDEGNVAKAFLYCLEIECPETGWKVPLSVSWVISKSRNIIAKLIPDPQRKRFDIRNV